MPTRPAPTPHTSTASGTCQTPDCSEYQVAKDYTNLPPGFRPVLCGICNVEIEITEAEE